MKHLRSSIDDMRRLFERAITVKDIAEPFASFDVDQPAMTVRNFLKSKYYDVVGIRRNGIIEDYALTSELGDGKLGGFAKTFESGAQVSDATSLLSVFELLRDRNWIFVTISDRVWGIATRGDLHKAPVRMWIYCLISLTEMHTLRIIRKLYPQQEWIDLKYLPVSRFERARELFEIRKRINEEVDLTDCLELCDKTTILLKTGTIVLNLGFTSNKKAKSFFVKVERLRNPLAHAQDIVTNRWPELADLVIGLEKFLKACEVFTPRD
jgi:hypothetical protein